MTPVEKYIRSILLLTVLWGSLQCHSRQTETGYGQPGFDDHVVLALHSLEHFRRLTAAQHGKLKTIKFILPSFQHRTPNSRVLYMDGDFYTFHDEWYWYRRLNGVPALGDRGLEKPPGCATPKDCTRWGRQQDIPPMGLRFVEDRMYAHQFYDMALGEHRKVGLGALVFSEGNEKRDAVFGFRLEYMDAPTSEEVLLFFSQLKSSLPVELAEQLVWIPRSPVQMALAKQMVSMKALPADRIISFSLLAEEGDAEIYNSGVTVGRLFLVDDDRSALVDADATHILIVRTPPDDLPQTAGVISAVPLSALSHLNILARNRGIPSAYVGGIFDDPWIRQLADGYAPVALAVRNGEVRITPLSESDFLKFTSAAPAIHFSADADWDAAPYVVAISDLQRLNPEDEAALIGGKGDGFKVLHEAVPELIPRQVAIVTTRAYRAHMAPLETELNALVTADVFQRSVKVRYFVLEGIEAYRRHFSSVEDALLIANLKRTSPRHYDWGMKGGVKARIRAMTMPVDSLADVTSELRRIFAAYPVNQGLRFRSSSTVEDIDGFSGAGLYVSSTGFLYAEKQQSEKERTKTVARALKKTWASYWNFQAFEERRHSGMDHWSGAMAVVVHPRFDDVHERANGVATFSWNFAGGYQFHRKFEEMTVNAHTGALSVTNPPAGNKALPETVNVRATDSESPVIERDRPEVVNGTERPVLTNDEYNRLFAACRRIAAVWRGIRNSSTAQYQSSQTVTLDLEFRVMSPDWGGFSSSQVATPELIIKQVRVLDSAPVIRDIFDRRLNLPRDVLREAVKVEQMTCAGQSTQIGFVKVWPSTGVGLQKEPFIGDVQIVSGDKIVRLAPHDYYQPTASGELMLAPDVARSLGVQSISLNEFVCDGLTLAESAASAMEKRSRDGRIIGRVQKSSYK